MNIVREAYSRVGFGLVIATGFLFACNSIVGVEDVSLQKGSSDAGSHNRSSNDNGDPSDRGPVTSNLTDSTPGKKSSTSTTTTTHTDAGTENTTPAPAKGPACLTGPTECRDLANKCGCAEDCCGHAGATCAQVGGLVDNTCCLPADVECVSDNDCCGQMLCKSNGAKTTCQ